MSYIRILSNPEGLYIWGDGKQIYISTPTQKNDTVIPQKTFDGLLKKYHKNFGEDTIFKGASIKDIFVKNKKLNPKFLWKTLGKYQGHFKMRLSYKNWHIDMWFVTWEYIARRFR